MSCYIFTWRAAISKSISLVTVISLTLTIIMASLTRRSPAFFPSLLSLSPSTSKRLHGVIAQVENTSSWVYYWKMATELSIVTKNNFPQIKYIIKGSYFIPSEVRIHKWMIYNNYSNNSFFHLLFSNHLSSDLWVLFCCCTFKTKYISSMKWH